MGLGTVLALGLPGWRGEEGDLVAASVQREAVCTESDGMLVFAGVGMFAYHYPLVRVALPGHISF